MPHRAIMDSIARQADDYRMHRWEVEEEQRKRCEEQGHSWENACSITFRVYQICKYCKAER